MALAGRAQVAGPDSTAAIVFSRTFTLPLSRIQVYDAALLAWQRSFGAEPAAKLSGTDPESGVLEGSARLNYRSTVLTAREETMGTIAYRVTISAGHGECTVRVTQLVHAGNRNAIKGGLGFGLLTGTVVPPGPHPGVSYRSAIRIYADLKQQTADRINALLAAFGSTLRQATGP